MFTGYVLIFPKDLSAGLSGFECVSEKMFTKWIDRLF